MGALDIAAPAVRTAISRMVRQRWLAPVKTTAGPGYQLTPRAEHRLTEAAARIYRRGIAPWDGRWHLLVLAHTPVRSTRDRMRTGLSYLGYAPLREDIWVSPRSSAEVDALLASEGVPAHRFQAVTEAEAIELTSMAWDLDELGQAYVCWLEEARVLAAQAHDQPTDQDAFVIRSLLVHEWRKFLFRDPGLPRELLPSRWPGHEAAAFFDSEASRLLAGAGRYVDACLQPNGEPR
jgi:phenylacetic acid degradation operon negative regulatory protein